MNRTPALRCAVAVALLLLARTSARAEPIVAPWFDATLATPHNVYANDPDAGHVRITGVSDPQFHFNSATITLANFKTFGGSPSEPAHFNDKPFSVVLAVYDAQSRELGAVTFTGAIEGTLGANGTGLSVDLTSPATERLHLGHHIYTITLDHLPFTGPPTAANYSLLTANVTVTNNPEPSALVLAALGLPLLGITLRRRRRA